MRHWNAIADTLNSGEMYLPLLLEDENGVTHANDWAKGFLRGMEFGREDWALLLDDEDHGGSLVPIFALANEHNPDPSMRPYEGPINTELRETLIAGAVAGTTQIYRYFKAKRDTLGNMPPFLRTMPKIGRNDPMSMRIWQEIQALLWQDHPAFDRCSPLLLAPHLRNFPSTRRRQPVCVSS